MKSPRKDRELYILLDAFVPDWRMLIEGGEWSEFVERFRVSSGKSRSTAYRFCNEADRLCRQERAGSGATSHLERVPGTNLFGVPVPPASD